VPQHDSSCAKALAGNRADESRLFRRGRNRATVPPSAMCCAALTAYSARGHNQAITSARLLALADSLMSTGCTSLIAPPRCRQLPKHSSPGAHRICCGVDEGLRGTSAVCHQHTTDRIAWQTMSQRTCSPSLTPLWHRENLAHVKWCASCHEQRSQLQCTPCSASWSLAQKAPSASRPPWWR
jgi:hypothetical protein